MNPSYFRLTVLVLLAMSACSREVFCAPFATSASTIVDVPALRTPTTLTVPLVLAAVIPDETAVPVVAAAAEPPADKVEAKATAPAVEAPLPSSRVRDAKEYFATLAHRFQPGAAKNLHAVFQFDLSGPNACAFKVAVDDGAVKVERGRATKPDVTIGASAEDYVKVVNGELGGFGAVMARKMKVGGNLTLARRMKKLFPPGHADK